MQAVGRELQPGSLVWSTVMTTEEAWELLIEYYPAATIDEDPEWAVEMVAALVDGDITLP